MKKIYYLIFIAGIILIVYSFFNPRKVYEFYNRTYYSVIKGDNKKEFIKKADELLKMNKFKKLENYLDKMVFVHKDNSSTMVKIAEYYFKTASHHKGARIIFELYEKERFGHSLLKSATDFFIKEKLYRDALSILKYHYTGGHQELSFNYGYLYFQLKQYSNAFEWFHRSFEEGNQTTRVFYYLGMSRYGMKDWQDALRYLERAYNKNPDNMDVKRYLARVYNKLGMHEKAVNLRK